MRYDREVGGRVCVDQILLSLFDRMNMTAVLDFASTATYGRLMSVMFDVKLIIVAFSIRLKKRKKVSLERNEQAADSV